LAAAGNDTSPAQSGDANGGGIGARMNIAFAGLAPKGLIGRWAADVDDTKDEHVDNNKNTHGDGQHDLRQKEEQGIHQHVDRSGEVALDAKREGNMYPMYVAGNDREYYDIQRRESFIEFMLDYDEEIDYDDGYRGIRIHDSDVDDDNGAAAAAISRLKGGGKRQVISDYGCVTKEITPDKPAKEIIPDKPTNKVVTKNAKEVTTTNNTRKERRPIKEENEQLRNWVKELTGKVEKLQSTLEDTDEEKLMWQQSAIELQAQLHELRNMEGG